MSILRTDKQADGLEMLKLIFETADFYNAMANLLDEEHFNNKLFSIANERKTFIEPFQKLVKELDELPVQPDPEKELLEELGGKLAKLISADSKIAILDKCLEKDEELAELIDNTSLGEESTETQSLINSLSDNLAATKKTLLALID